VPYVCSSCVSCTLDRHELEYDNQLLLQCPLRSHTPVVATVMLMRLPRYLPTTCYLAGQRLLLPSIATFASACRRSSAESNTSVRTSVRPQMRCLTRFETAYSIAEQSEGGYDMLSMGDGCGSHERGFGALPGTGSLMDHRAHHRTAHIVAGGHLHLLLAGGGRLNPLRAFTASLSGA